MPRKKISDQAAIAEQVEPEKPKRRRKKKEPVALADPLAEVKARFDLKAAEELPKQLPAPEPKEPPFEPGSFAARIENERPKFGPVPPGFIDVKTDTVAGIRVSKKLWRDQDGNERSTAALQFAEDRKLSRNTESPLVDKVEDKGFLFRSHTRQWQHDNDPVTQTPGENIIDALKLMAEVKQARGEGRGNGRAR